MTLLTRIKRRMMDLSTSRSQLVGATPTPDFDSFDSFYISSMGSNITIQNPASIPVSGVWYCDLTVNATGGYTLAFDTAYTKELSYYFDCLPNAVYRLWFVSRGGTTLDVSVTRVS